MNRHTALIKLPSHPMLGKLFQNLTHDELELVVAFVCQREHLSKDEYMTAVNRWFLDQPKPKHYADMWAIVSQVVNG